MLAQSLTLLAYTREVSGFHAAGILATCPSFLIVFVSPSRTYSYNKNHVHTCSDRNRIITLMRLPNTDSTPNKPVTLPRNQLLISYAGTGLVHTVTIRCYDAR